MPASAAQRPSPEHGSRLLFFSGGTALKDTAHELTRFTHNSVHLITPFDSGGSSAALRRAFAMPAVGDLRARIIALADHERPGNPEAYTLFAYRLPKESPASLLRNELRSLVNGRHLLLAQIPPSLRETIQGHVRAFYKAMPPDFPLAGANIGNLVLTAGYLEYGRRLGRAVELYSRILHARGRILPVAEAAAHLAVRLENGQVIVGQHRFTGKERLGVQSAISQIWLTPSEDSQDKADIAIEPGIEDLITNAQAICYPIGSFYSSVVANLLPRGVGRAVAANPCPKIFVPNLGVDPELVGHSLEMQIYRLLAPLLADAPGARARDLLTMVLVDGNAVYPGGLPEAQLRELGIRLVTMPLVREDKGPLADARMLASALIASCA